MPCHGWFRPHLHGRRRLLADRGGPAHASWTLTDTQPDQRREVRPVGVLVLHPQFEQARRGARDHLLECVLLIGERRRNERSAEVEQEEQGRDVSCLRACGHRRRNLLSLVSREGPAEQGAEQDLDPGWPGQVGARELRRERDHLGPDDVLVRRDVAWIG